MNARIILALLLGLNLSCRSHAATSEGVSLRLHAAAEHRITLRLSDQVILETPAEGLWSVATDWTDG